MVTNLIIVVVAGLLVGFIAGFFYRARKHSLVINLGAGIAGAVLGLWLFGLMELGLGVQTSNIILSSVLGAILVVATIAVSKR